MSALIGQQISNYQIQGILGQGGFASVYIGKHIYLENYAAIKILHSTLPSNQSDNFMQEARILAQLSHPHIIRILEFGVEGDLTFLVMDYAPKGSLRQRHTMTNEAGQFVPMKVPLTAVVDYVKQIASALQYAHEQRCIHRDLKPDNILIDQNGKLLVSDFGLARFYFDSAQKSSELALSSNIAGTFLYMAPEQFEGKARSANDQYSLAVMAYEWLAGTLPFQGNVMEVISQHVRGIQPPSLRAANPTIPASIEQVIFKALSKNHHDRFADIATFAWALEQALPVVPRGRFSPVTLLPQSTTEPDKVSEQATRQLLSDAVFPRQQETSSPLQPPGDPSSAELSLPPATPVPSPLSTIPMLPSPLVTRVLSTSTSATPVRSSSTPVPSSSAPEVPASSFPFTKTSKRKYLLIGLTTSVALIMIFCTSFAFALLHSATNTAQHASVPTQGSSTTPTTATTATAIASITVPSAHNPTKPPVQLAPPGNGQATQAETAPSPTPTNTPTPQASPTPTPSPTPSPIAGGCTAHHTDSNPVYQGNNYAYSSGSTVYALSAACGNDVYFAFTEVPPVTNTQVRACLPDDSRCGNWSPYAGVNVKVLAGEDFTSGTSFHLEFQGYGATGNYTVFGDVYL